MNVQHRVAELLAERAQYLRRHPDKSARIVSFYNRLLDVTYAVYTADPPGKNDIVYGPVTRN
mgnify:CR=1